MYFLEQNNTNLVNIYLETLDLLIEKNNNVKQTIENMADLNGKTHIHYVVSPLEFGFYLEK